MNEVKIKLCYVCKVPIERKNKYCNSCQRPLSICENPNCRKKFKQRVRHQISRHCSPRCGSVSGAKIRTKMRDL